MMMTVHDRSREKKPSNLSWSEYYTRSTLKDCLNGWIVFSFLFTLQFPFFVSFRRRLRANNSTLLQEESSTESQGPMDKDSYSHDDDDRRDHYEHDDDPYYQDQEEEEDVALPDHEDYRQDDDDGYGAYGSGYMPPPLQQKEQQQHAMRRSQGPVDMDDYDDDDDEQDPQPDDYEYSHHHRQQRRAPPPPSNERAMHKSLADQAVGKRQQQLQKQQQRPQQESMSGSQQPQRHSGNYRRSSADSRRESKPSSIAKAIHYGQDHGDEKGWGNASFQSQQGGMPQQSHSMPYPSNHLPPKMMEEESDIDHDEFHDALEWEAPDPMDEIIDDHSRGSGSNHSRPSSTASSGRRSSNGTGRPVRRFSNFMQSKRKVEGNNEELAERSSLFGALTSSVTMATSVVTSTVNMTANVATSTVGAIGQVGSTIMTAGGQVGGSGTNVSERRASNQGASTMQSFFDRRKPKHPPKNTKIASRELEIIKRCQEAMENRESLEEERRLKALAHDEENLKLRRLEEAEREAVTQEVLAYREMVKDMGQEEKLAPEDMKKAAEEYDDRLAMADTLAGMFDCLSNEVPGFAFSVSNPTILFLLS